MNRLSIFAGYIHRVENFTAYLDRDDHRGSTATTTTTATITTTSQVYTWENAVHRVPQDFELPKDTVLIAWQHYCCGDTAKVN